MSYQPNPLLPVLLLILCTLLNSCSKDSNDVTPEKVATVKDIYVCGTNYSGIATIWKNGVATTLNDGLDPSLNSTSIANQMVINGNDTYVVGLRANRTSTNYGTIWKNGIPSYLESNGKLCHANTITVSNNNIYVGGEIDGIATIWKNGIPESIIMSPPAPFFSTIEAISISNNNVYSIIRFDKPNGFFNTIDSKSKILKNGVVFDFTNGTTYESINALYTVNNDVYVAGYLPINGSHPKAVLWKNGVLKTLSDGTEETFINGICVINNDCYVGGATAIYDNNTTFPIRIGYKATIWKNGVPSYLVSDTSPGELTEVMDLKSVNNDVFALVLVNGKLSIWKNGVFFQDVASSVNFTKKNMYISTN